MEGQTLFDAVFARLNNCAAEEVAVVVELESLYSI